MPDKVVVFLQGYNTRTVGRAQEQESAWVALMWFPLVGLILTYPGLGWNICCVTRGNKGAEEASLSLTDCPALYSEEADDYVIDWGGR